MYKNHSLMPDEHPLDREERLLAEAEQELMYGKKEDFKGEENSNS